MELQRRFPSRPRVPTWRKLAPRGLGFDTSAVSCADLTPWQQSQDPRCGGGTAAPVYVAPTLVPVPACATGNPYEAGSAECQAQLMAAQQTNLAAQDAANRAVFLANCNRDWELNATQYRTLGMAVPPNDCAYRGYGQTNVGPGYLPGTPQSIIDWRNENPGGGSPGAATTATGAGPANSAGAVFSFTNLTSGDNTNFKVGDRWEIVISGAAPNAPVTFNGGLNGVNQMYPMGNTDASGVFRANGQMGQAEIGNWSEAWRVSNQIIASFSFNVKPAAAAGTTATVTTAGNTGGGQTAKTTTSVFDTLPGGSIEIGGTSIPLLALAAVAAFFLFKGGR